MISLAHHAIMFPSKYRIQHTWSDELYERFRLSDSHIRMDMNALRASNFRWLLLFLSCVVDII